MCLLLVALIGLLAFYLSGQIEHWYLVEKTDGITFNLASSWSVLHEMWAALLMMFLAGILFVLLVMKLIPSKTR